MLADQTDGVVVRIYGWLFAPEFESFRDLSSSHPKNKMTTPMGKLTQIRSLLMSSVIFAILIEELVGAVATTMVLGHQLTVGQIIWAIGKFTFAMLWADITFGRIVLSFFAVYFLPEITIPNKSTLFLTYLSAAVLSAVGAYFFSARYAMMFVGESLWLKPIFSQCAASVAAGFGWSVYTARSLGKEYKDS